MKKIIFMFAGLMAFSFVNAQISGGIKGGLNFANVALDPDVISTDSRTGLQFGGFGVFNLSDQFSLQGELLFSQKGYGFTFIESINVNLSYLDIPVLARFNINEMISLHAGPQLGLLLSSKSKTDNAEEDMDNVNGMDLALAFGGQVDLPMGFIGGVRYNLGLSDINDDDNDDVSAKNNVFQIYIGYKLFSN